MLIVHLHRKEADMFYITLDQIKLNMFVGIRDFEYLAKQPVVVNVKLFGTIPYRPTKIEQCLDYSKVSDYLKSWENRPHVDLIETLLFDLVEFCFSDSRITEVHAEILKPTIIDFSNYVGIGMNVTREIFELKKNDKK